MNTIQTPYKLLARRWLTIVSLFLLLPLLTSQTTISIPSDIPSLTLTQRQTCDLELIMNGGFAPLETFMNRQDYERVVNEMRLANGTVWPMPIVLDVQEKNIEKVRNASQIALRDQEGFVLAILTVDEIWKPNRLWEAEKVYGTTDIAHPGVNYLLNQTGDYYVTGKLTKVKLPQHFDFVSLRKTPQELKEYFKANGYDKVVAFQTRNPMHRAHLELTKRAAASVGAHLLIHPSVGMTKPGDVDHFTRVKCYQKLIKYFPEGSATLSLLPLAMRMGGPREALWHAIIRKNYGATHFIVGRDHAGPGKNSQGRDFYDPYAAQQLVQAYAKEIGIEVVPFREVVYVKDDDNYQPVDEIPPGKKTLAISGTQLRKMLNEGADIPDWFSFPEIVEELKKVYPPRAKQGFTVFFTGLSGAGKSTIAKGLAIKLTELQDRPVTILDGDVIRTHLSSELGFSKEHRSLNVRRVGFVASEITKNRGAAICAMIAPYEQDRKYNRDLISGCGNYIEVYVSTPISVCEDRDTKGLYSLAKQGKLTGFTGVDDPYEEPSHPEIVIDTSQCSVEEAVELILSHLRLLKHIE
jgi:sulfate adenylyltransferase